MAWFDKTALKPGDNWDQHLRSAVQRCACFCRCSRPTPSSAPKAIFGWNGVKPLSAPRKSRAANSFFLSSSILITPAPWAAMHWFRKHSRRCNIATRPRARYPRSLKGNSVSSCAPCEERGRYDHCRPELRSTSRTLGRGWVPSTREPSDSSMADKTKARSCAGWC